jgi:hypothetical protein
MADGGVMTVVLPWGDGYSQLNFTRSKVPPYVYLAGMQRTPPRCRTTPASNKHHAPCVRVVWAGQT